MTNREIMKKYLLSDVISALLDDGFTGSFPHYRKTVKMALSLSRFKETNTGAASP